MKMNGMIEGITAIKLWQVNLACHKCPDVVGKDGVCVIGVMVLCRKCYDKYILPFKHPFKDRIELEPFRSAMILKDRNFLGFRR